MQIILQMQFKKEVPTNKERFQKEAFKYNFRKKITSWAGIDEFTSMEIDFPLTLAQSFHPKHRYLSFYLQLLCLHLDISLYLFFFVIHDIIIYMCVYDE